MNKHKTPDFLFKVVLIGNSAVGKSSILKAISDPNNKLLDRVFTPTIGVDLKIQTFEVEGKLVKLQIWDTAGQEKFKSICRSYYKGSNGIVFVYDVTNRKSFGEVENWIDDVERIAGKDMTNILVGNKSDLQDDRKVSYEEGKTLAEKLGMMFIETSAKTCTNVVELFGMLAKVMKSGVEKKSSVLEKPNSKEKSKTLELNKPKDQSGKKWASCCSNV